MCTAVTYKTKDFYFGRTLDYEFSYGEEVTVTPRNYRFVFSGKEIISSHYAIIGMAHNEDDYPLYYDAVNEKGLAVAGLNFVGNAFYGEESEGRKNIAQFEFIPWLLSRCDSTSKAIELIKDINITGKAFNKALKPAQLHWMVSDKKESITVEAVREGLKIYENPVGVLTNNPAFDIQMFSLNNYRNLSACSRDDKFAQGITLDEYSRGMGAIGLPGDLSSQSRFVRAAFVKNNSVSGDSENESVGQMFHILNSVEQQRGCCRLSDGKYEITIYTSCCNADKGIYYYTTYNNHQITSVDMHETDLNGSELVRYRLITEEQIMRQHQ